MQKCGYGANPNSKDPDQSVISDLIKAFVLHQYFTVSNYTVSGQEPPLAFSLIYSGPLSAVRVADGPITARYRFM